MIKVYYHTPWVYASYHKISEIKQVPFGSCISICWTENNRNERNRVISLVREFYVRGYEPQPKIKSTLSKWVNSEQQEGGSEITLWDEVCSLYQDYPDTILELAKLNICVKLEPLTKKAVAAILKAQFDSYISVHKEDYNRALLKVFTKWHKNGRSIVRKYKR